MASRTLPIFLMAAIVATAMAERSMICYSCMGFDPDLPSNYINNTKSCEEGAFSTDIHKETGTIDDSGVNRLFCYTVSFWGNGFNNNNWFTVRGVGIVPKKHSSSSVLDSILKTRDIKAHTGAMMSFICNDESLCNSGASSVVATVGLLFAILPVALQRFFF